MARRVARGEVWMIDVGMAAKVRPCLILSVEFHDDEKAVVTYVARSTQRRGGRFDIERSRAAHRGRFSQCREEGRSQALRAAAR